MLVGIGMVLQFASIQLSKFGFINLAFYLAVLAAMAPDNALSFKQGLAPGISVGGHWGAGALVLFASMFPVFTQGAKQAWSHMGANSLRWLVVGTVVSATHLLSPPMAVATAAVGGALAYLLVDSSLINGLMQSADEHELNVWNNIRSHNSLTLPLQVLFGVVAATCTAVFSLPAVALLSAPLTMFVRQSLRASEDDIHFKETENWELKVKNLEFQLDGARKEKAESEEDLKSRKEELVTIYDLARSLGASTNLSETTQLVQSMIRRLRIPYQSCVIFLSKPGGGLEPTLADTPYQEVLNMSGLLQLQEPFILQVLRDPRPYMNNEVSPSTAEQRIFKDERSLLVVPLMVSKENVGIIYLGSVNPKTHRDEHLEKLKMLAAFAAPSIKTALLFEHKEKDLQSERQIREAVEAKNNQLNGLQKLGSAIGASLKIENTFRVVAENLKQMVPGAQSVILFGVSQKDAHVLKAEFINSPYSEYIRSLEIRNDEGILGKVTELGRTMLVIDTEHSDHQNVIMNERSVVVAPLKAEEETLGILYVGAANAKTFTDEHRSLVETVSYQAAIAVKNARLYEQTQQMAFTDGLTGLYLHRFFQVRLSEEIAWADRYKKNICLVMVDTDHFKSFNDTLGHPAGDALLQEIALLLKDKVRTTDVVCRYGGDEFALILKDVPKEEAIRTCERIRETFQLRFAAAAVQVTSSIGLACYPSDATNKKDLAKAADDALYVSKRGGRNRVTASPTLEEKKHLPEIVQETLPR